MENERIVKIVSLCFLLVAVIFIAIWIFEIIFPLIDWAEFMASMGFTYGGTVEEILIYLFYNIYFIIAITFAIVALIIWIVAKLAFKGA